MMMKPYSYISLTRDVAEVLPAGVRFCSAATSAHESSTAAPETTGAGEASTAVTVPSATTTATKDANDSVHTESSDEADSTDAAVTASPMAALGLLVAGVVALL